MASSSVLINTIQSLKKGLGDELAIMTHHYQRKEIVDLGDYSGDSFELSRKASGNKTARYIVFCGVYFMAESAAILAEPEQTIQIPALEAGCLMADMADFILLERNWKELESITGPGNITPIVYMNSSSELKAFCGSHEGIVCTSSNAVAALKWGFSRSDKILFLPDQHLGRNTGNNLGISPEKMIVWNPHVPLGGNTRESIENAAIILWDGYCQVHTRFLVEHILKMRREYPEASIIVHPECTQEVVRMADAVGSTSSIVKYIDTAPSGSTIIVGTEINLVNRLKMAYPDKEILPLHASSCRNMAKINLENLLLTLKNIGKINIVTVPREIKTEARIALDRMLSLT